MSAKRLLVVIGATGNQGGSVIRAVLGDAEAQSQFRIRAITRDPNSKKSQALTAQGVECVRADLDTKDHLVSAFQDAYAVFGVTNFWEKADANVEVQQGKNIADAAKETGVQHLIFSTLMNVEKLSRGVFSHVRHFDSKATIEEYIRSVGIPSTFVLPGFFMSNIPGGLLRKTDDGSYAMAAPFRPNTPIPLFDAEQDTGKFVKAALKKRDQVLGKRILEATAYYTPEQIIRGFQTAFPNSGKNATYKQIPGEAYKQMLLGAGMSEVVAEELTQNMTFIPEFGYYGGESLDESLSILDDAPKTWEEFVRTAPAFNGLN